MMTTILICYIPAGLIFVLFCGITGLLDLPVLNRLSGEEGNLSNREEGYLITGMILFWPLVLLIFAITVVFLIGKSIRKAAPYWSVVPRFLFGTVKFWVMVPARMTTKER